MNFSKDQSLNAGKRALEKSELEGVLVNGANSFLEDTQVKGLNE